VAELLVKECQTMCRSFTIRVRLLISSLLVVWACGPIVSCAREAVKPEDQKLSLVIRYRTDPERIARVLPPPLEPDDVAEVVVDWYVRHPTAGTQNIFFPGPYTESGIHVTARYGEHRGMFQVGMPLLQEWGRATGREGVGLVKKDGDIKIWREGDTVRASLERRGKLLFRIETEVTEEPAHPLDWARETGFGAFLYRYRLDPDWRQGPLGPDPVGLWRRVLGGHLGFYPTEMVEGPPRACDLARTTFELVDPSPLDPFVEFPLREIVGMSYYETGLVPEVEERFKAPDTPSTITHLSNVDREAFEPWALYIYDRPISDGTAWQPPGWPEQSTAFKLTSEELESYRSRPALELGPLEALDLVLEIDPKLHASTLPPALEVGDRPQLRILEFRVERSDLSTVGFTELWLLSRCLLDGGEAWYALANVVGDGGDVVFRREVFGAPSKRGEVAWAQGDDGLAVSGSRMGRTFFDCRIQTVEATAGLAPSSMTVIGLRLHPPYQIESDAEPSPSRADLIAQNWSFGFTSSLALDPATVSLTFPRTAGVGMVGSTDPWYEFEDARIVSAQLSQGRLSLAPGRVLQDLPDFMPHYIERYDGALTIPEAISGQVRHSFLVKR
jgi:hypothetical protein